MSANIIGLNVSTPSLPTMLPPPKMSCAVMSAQCTRQAEGRGSPRSFTVDAALDDWNEWKPVALSPAAASAGAEGSCIGRLPALLGLPALLVYNVSAVRVGLPAFFFFRHS